MAQNIINSSSEVIHNSEVLTKGTVKKKALRFILALQHLIAMFGATVLVPIVTGFNPSVALISAGIGTLIFHMVTKKKVPVFLGSSFAFIPVILSVKNMYNGDLSYAQGGIISAGFLYVLASFFIKKIGVKRIEKYLPPQVIGSMIIVIGLNLIPTAFKMASNNLLIASITLGIALLINFLAKGFLKQLAILIAVTFGYLISLSLGLVNTKLITEASIIAMPKFNLPKFSISAIAIISPVVLAVFMEHIGDIITNGQVVGKDFIKNPGLNRTLLGDGLATMFAGFIGAPANTTYGENTGVLAITKNYDPSILRLTAICAIFLGFVSKVGGVLKSIPVCVMGGISMMLFSMISLIGVKTIKNGNVKVNFKNIIVIITILFLGLGSGIIQNKFGITIGIPVTNTVKISGLSFAAIIGVLLNAILNVKTIKNK